MKAPGSAQPSRRGHLLSCSEASLTCASAKAWGHLPAALVRTRTSQSRMSTTAHGAREAGITGSWPELLVNADIFRTYGFKSRNNWEKMSANVRTGLGLDPADPRGPCVPDAADPRGLGSDPADPWRPVFQTLPGFLTHLSSVFCSLPGAALLLCPLCGAHETQEKPGPTVPPRSVNETGMRREGGRRMLSGRGQREMRSLAVAGIWGVNQWTQGQCLALCLSNTMKTAK